MNFLLISDLAKLAEIAEKNIKVIGLKNRDPYLMFCYFSMLRDDLNLRFVENII